MNLELFEQETRMPLLGAVDIGMSGAILSNDLTGSLTMNKMPRDDSGVDLIALKEILSPLEFVLIEHQPPPNSGPKFFSRNTANSVFAQYKEIYGLLVGMEKDFYAITPMAWQSFLGFPKRKEIGEEVWKDFLHDQSRMRFPGIKMPKYSADAYLLYDVVRKLWAIQDRNLWP